jgi:nucleoside-diphosphate kinase
MELTKLTFAMIKPDAVAAKNSGKIIDMIEHNGFEIVRLQKVIISQELAEEFYAEHKERPFFRELVEFVTSGPVFIMALHKENAISLWRDLIGVTDPFKAESGTIRKLYGTDIGKNAVHGSADSESAVKELALFFPDLFEQESSEGNCSKGACSDDDGCCMNDE